jgi:mannitol-specific phosphotransferase system IIBC component
MTPFYPMDSQIISAIIGVAGAFLLAFIIALINLFRRMDATETKLKTHDTEIEEVRQDHNTERKDLKLEIAAVKETLYEIRDALLVSGQIKPRQK